LQKEKKLKAEPTMADKNNRANLWKKTDVYIYNFILFIH